MNVDVMIGLIWKMPGRTSVHENANEDSDDQDLCDWQKEDVEKVT